ncbi:hypothetical protein FNP24_001448 [Enterococcus faecalis]|nr:hypothetical protein [Enterococcus faecalis]EIT2199253.1 hypothetical protein [Enterococcus faecalis]EKS9963127.1 hypothetical protein [Enterococcus faecalis]
MRYLDEITFVKKSSESHYDPNSGEWIEEEPFRKTADVNATDIGTDRSITIFGSIKEGAKVIRTQPLFVIPEFDYIEFEGKTWEVITSRVPALRNSLIIQEVIIDGTKSSKN